MALTWEVDGTTKTTYHLKEDSTTKATITGLNEGIVDKLPTTLSSNEIELSADVLPKNGGKVQLTEGTETYTLKLENGIPTDETAAADGYDVKPETAGGDTITFKKKTKAYYTLSGNTITCVAEKTDTNAAATISGLKSGVTASDITYDSTFLNKEIKLKASALVQAPTADSKVSFSTTASFTLALTTDGDDKVTAGGEKTGDIVVELDTVDENATERTATVKQKLTAGWKAPTTAEGNVKFVYVAEGADELATVSNLSTTATANDISASTSTTEGENPVTTVTLKTGALIANKDKKVAITSNSVTGYTNTFALNLYSVQAPGAKDGDPYLDIATPTEGAPTTTATVKQNLTAGWKLVREEGADKGKVVYEAPEADTLSSITGLDTDASKDTVKLNGKVITLEDAALVHNADTSVVLTQTADDNLHATDKGNGDGAYTLALDGDVKKNQNQATGAMLTAVEDDTAEGEDTATSKKATVSEELDEYFAVVANTVGDPGTEVANTKITYTAARAADTPLVTVTGLGMTAAGGDNLAEGTTANVIFNTDAGTITLNEGALPTSPTMQGVEEATATSTITLDGAGYRLVRGTGVAASSDDEGTPQVTVESTTATIKTGTKTGWDANNEDNITTLTYNVPTAVNLATINNVASNSADAIIVDANNVITLKKDALNSTAEQPLTLANTNGNKYASKYAFTLALDTSEGSGIDIYGSDEDKLKPVLSINNAETAAEGETQTGEPEGTKTANVTITKSAGWELSTDKMTVTNHSEAEKIVLAKVVNLDNIGASYTKDGENNTVEFDEETKTITLKKGALQTYSGSGEYTAGTYDVELKDGTSSEYMLAIFTSDKEDDAEAVVGAPATAYLPDSLEIVLPGAEGEQGDGSEPEGGENGNGGAQNVTPAAAITATIKGTLNEGWVLSGKTLTYTAPATDTTLGTISGLAANADTTTAITFQTDDGNNNTNVILLTEDAFIFNDDEDDDETEDGTVAAGAKVVLTNSVDNISNFQLALVNPDSETLSDKPTVDKIGFALNNGWAVSGTTTTTAKYNQAKEEGWTLTTTGNNANKEVVYTARIDPSTATTGVTTLMQINNLAKGLKVGETSDSISAVGTEVTQTVESGEGGTTTETVFVPGLWINTEYDADTSTNGKITISRNVLGTGTSSLSGTSSGNYDLVLNTEYAKDLYVLQKSDFTNDGESTGTLVNKNIWVFNKSTGEATYKAVAPAYWTLDGKKITYTAQTSGTDIARIKGLNKNLVTADIDDFYSKGNTGAEDFQGNVLLAAAPTEELDNSSVNSSLVKLTTEYADATDEEPATIGVFTVSKGALLTNGTKAEITTGKTQYGLALNDADGDDGKVDAPVYSNKTWALDSTTKTTAHYTTKVTTAGYELTDKTVIDAEEGTYSAKSISYVAATTGENKNTLATITGLKSGLTLTDDGKVGGEDGITAENGVITLNANVLGSTSVTLTNGTNQDFKLDLGEDVPNPADDDVKNGIDVLRFNAGNDSIVYYKHVTPEYYTLDSKGLKITRTAENAGTTYATISNVKSGLKLGKSSTDAEDQAIGTYSGDTFTSVLEIKKDYAAKTNDTSEVIGVITAKEGVLDSTGHKTLTLANGTGKKYIFELDNLSEGNKVKLDGTPAWTVSNGTATLKGKMTAGWSVDDADAPTKVTYHTAATDKELAKITGLKTTLTTFEPTTTNEAIALSANSLGAGTVKLTNNTVNGVTFNYTIGLDEAAKTAATAAVTGDERWYFDGTTPTTINYGFVHDAHYVQGTKTVEGQEPEDDNLTINYVAKVEDKPIFTISNLASGLKLNVADGDGYYKGNTPVKYKDSSGAEPTDGITLSGQKVTMKAGALTTDASKPTTITNNTLTKYLLEAGADAGRPSAKEMLNLNGTTLTLYKANSAGYTLKESSTQLVYSAADTVKTDNTLATITGLKSGLTQRDLAVGTVDSDTNNFTAAIIHTAGAKTFTIGKAALDTSSKVAITTGTGYSLKLGNDITEEDKPKADQPGWVVEGTTAKYNKGTTAGWTLPTAGDDKGKIVYQAADFATKADGSNTLATVTDLKSGLKSASNYKSVVDSKNNTAVSVADTTITLTNFALNAKNVMLKNGENQNFTLAVKTDGTADDGKVTLSNTTKIWTKDSKDTTKAVYTIDTTAGYVDSADAATIKSGEVEYDDHIAYLKAEKKTATLTGLGSGATLSGGTATPADGNTLAGVTLKDTDSDGNLDTIEVAKTALPTAPSAANKDTTLKLANSKTSYKLALADGVNSALTNSWSVNNGTATYRQSYAANSYVQKSDTEYTFEKNGKDITLLTISGLDKTNSALTTFTDKDANGKAKDKPITTEAFTTMTGISLAKKTESELKALTTPAVTNGQSGQFNDEEPAAETKTYNVVVLGDRTKLANGNVTLKNSNGADYVLYANVKDAQSTEGTVESSKLTATNYTTTAPLWTFSKGTLTLATGTGDYWTYKATKTGYDYTSLVYKKAATSNVATVKGLNTDLVLNGSALYTKAAEGATDANKVLSLTTDSLDGSSESPYKIALKAGALVTGKALKNNVKVALTLPKAKSGETVTEYALDVGGISAATAIDATAANPALKSHQEENKWSINNGVASYQYKTSTGWTLDKDAKNFTYSNVVKTTTLAQIKGLDKELSTFNGAVDAKTKKKADVPIGSTDFQEKTGIVVDDTLKNDDGDRLTTFTLTSKEALAGGNVTLTKVDKTSGMDYKIFAEGIEVEDYEPQWTVKGTAGTAVLTSGTTDGYSNPDDSDKNREKNYGNLVKYTKAVAEVTYATVSGLKKDPKTLAEGQKSLETLINTNEALTFDVDEQKIMLNSESILGGTTVSIASGKIPGTNKSYNFTFDEGALTTLGSVSSSSIDADKTPTLEITKGTLNVVETAGANHYATSMDGKKLEFNKNAKKTILATVKGLNKDLAVHDGSGTNGSTYKGKIVMTTTTGKGKDAKVEYKTTELVNLAANGTININEAALAKSNVTFSLNKAVEEGTYSVELDSNVKTKETYENLTKWTINNGTASYRNYDEGYYTEDGKGGYKYTPETKGTTFATITGLNPSLTVSSFGSSGTITLDNTMLNNKSVVLKNNINKDTKTDFVLALSKDTDANKKVALSSLTGFDWALGATSKLTATQGTGYLQQSDTQINYLKDPKKNQLVATITGLNKNVKITTTPSSESADLNITLKSTDLDNKSVTLTTTALTTGKYALELDGEVKGPEVIAATTGTNKGWWYNNGTATFTGLVTKAGYMRAESNMAITYTKTVGTPAKEASGTTKAVVEKPAAVMTIKNVTGIEDNGTKDGVTVTGNVSGKAATMSNGLIPVTFKDTNNILGSNDADTITVVDTGASVKGGKGDDKITLGSGKDTVLYANGDGNDVIANFTSNDVIKLTGGKLTSVIQSGSDAVVKVGTGSIKLSGYNGAVNIVDNKDKELWSTTATSSSDVLLADDNYSPDAAALSDIVEPFHASYTPYDFEAGLDLVKQNSFTPAITYTGDDKK